MWKWPTRRFEPIRGIELRQLMMGFTSRRAMDLILAGNDERGDALVDHYEFGRDGTDESAGN